MRESGWGRWITGCSVVLVLRASGLALAQEPPQAPPPRSIPGITAEEAFPSACVSCHVVLPDGMDVRLSTLMQGWTGEVDSVLLAKAQAASPAGLTLAGKHPEAPEALANIPGGCLSCHGRDATLAPPFGRMLHRIHLVGGEANHFLTLFQGECTHCHKLDLTTGAWSIPSAPEPSE